MKTFEKQELDYFLEISLIAGLHDLEIDREYTCIHDDNEGNSDQCLKITLKKDSSGNEFFHLKTPTSPGLRFRTYAGGGASLQVHNALKVLVYASFQQESFLPGLERENPSKSKILQGIKDILEGVIVLPSEIFADKRSFPHYFFGITPYLKVAISFDNDTHILTELTAEPEKQISEESTLWNPEPFVFSLNSNCSHAVYNALILLAIAIKQSSH